MPDNPNSLADRLKRWEQLRDTVPSILEQAPHMREDYTAFAAALATLIELEHTQEASTARLREATRLRDEQDIRVRLLNNKVVAGLQAQFGPEQERLIEFGIPPRRRRKPRKKEQPTAPPATPQTAN
jgi:hypothetical protein